MAQILRIFTKILDTDSYDLMLKVGIWEWKKVRISITIQNKFYALSVLACDGNTIHFIYGFSTCKSYVGKRLISNH
jgi:hypothetical protein